MLRSVLVLALLATTALAGCADTGVNSLAPEETTAADETVKATKTTGVIRGVVVDNTVTPIADAIIKIKALKLETVSLPDGSFGFSDLEPGTYFLEVTKLGFGKVQSSAPVQAGVDKPAIVRIQLTADPSTAPLVTLYTFDGYIECSWVAFAVALAMCSVPELVGIDLGDEFITYIDVEEIPTFTQTEMIWDATQVAGSSLQLSVFDGTTSGPLRTNGVSPQFLKADSAFWENGTGGSKNSSPMLGDYEQISFRVFAGWLEGSNPATGWGVGVTISQDFAMYTSIFQNITPDEDWMFIYDGDYQV